MRNLRAGWFLLVVILSWKIAPVVQAAPTTASPSYSVVLVAHQGLRATVYDLIVRLNDQNVRVADVRWVKADRDDPLLLKEAKISEILAQVGYFRSRGNKVILVLPTRTLEEVEKRLRQSSPSTLLGVTGHRNDLKVLHFVTLSDRGISPRETVLDLSTGANVLLRAKPAVSASAVEKSPAVGLLRVFGQTCAGVGCREYRDIERVHDDLVSPKGPTGGVRSFIFLGGSFCHPLAKAVATSKPDHFYVVGFKPEQIRTMAIQMEDVYWKVYLGVFVNPNACYEGSHAPLLTSPVWTLGVPVTVAGDRAGTSPEEARAIALASIAVLAAKENIVDLKKAGLFEALVKIGRLIEVSVSDQALQVAQEKSK